MSRHAALPQPVAHWLPVLSVVAGIGAFSTMDAVMKGASLAAGVYTALFWRNVLGTAVSLPIWLVSGGRGWPRREVMVVHAQRSVLTAVMAWLFFYGLVRIPIAEGIAISFIAPIVALYFAAVLLGERIRPQAILASLLGVAGVLVIGAGRLGAGQYTPEAIKGTIAILCSAMFYAVNLVLQRKQALMAGPAEIALFQNGIVALVLLPFLPFLGAVPDAGSLALIAAAAGLATLALLLLAWGYARAEAQVLVPIEYSGFLWASLFGWLLFDERVDAATLAGAALIVVGSWLGARNRPIETIV